MFTAPVKVLSAATPVAPSRRVPAPVLLRAPAPVMTPERMADPPVGTMNVPGPVSVTPLAEVNAVPVNWSAPVFPAAKVTAVAPVLAPRLASTEAESVPALTDVMPV